MAMQRSHESLHTMEFSRPHINESEDRTEGTDNLEYHTYMDIYIHSVEEISRNLIQEPTLYEVKLRTFAARLQEIRNRFNSSMNHAACIWLFFKTFVSV